MDFMESIDLFFSKGLLLLRTVLEGLIGFLVTKALPSSTESVGLSLLLEAFTGEDNGNILVVVADLASVFPAVFAVSLNLLALTLNSK